MTDHFLRIAPLGIGWVHPSWRDLVIEQLREDPGARARFLAACGLANLVTRLAEDGTAPELRGIAESVLARIEARLSELTDSARSAIEIGRFSERLEAERWFVPDDLAARPSRELITSETFTAREVDRVLEDL